MMLTTLRPWASRRAMINSGLPPGSTTMACLVTGSPMIVQLHCNGPTGEASRISAGFTGSIEAPVGCLVQLWRSAVDHGDVQEESPIPVACPDQTQRVAPTALYIQYPGRGKNLGKHDRARNGCRRTGTVSQGGDQQAQLRGQVLPFVHPRP